jgi:hypothetical protein
VSQEPQLFSLKLTFVGSLMGASMHSGLLFNFGVRSLHVVCTFMCIVENF